MGTGTEPSGAAQAAVWRNDDVDWDAWPVEEYLEENYRELHAADAAIIEHHSAWYRSIPAGSVDLSLELGVGPNLYPLMLQAAASRHVHALDRSAANLAYLTRQLRQGPDAHWGEFYGRCRAGNPDLPESLTDALARVEVVPGDARGIAPGRYGLGSMHFVAETMSEDPDQFQEHCRTFCEAVRPGGYLVAAFMENLERYPVGSQTVWPGFKVDADGLREVFGPYTVDLAVDRIDDDPTLPEYGYTGMLMLTARRPG